MPQKPKPDQMKLIAQTALSLAEAQGWNHVTFKDIARRAKCTEAEVTALFPNIWTIIIWHLEDIEQETKSAVEEHLTDNWRENLTEILMMRFEIAQRHKKAWQSLPDAFKAHPRQWRHLSELFYKMMSRMLKFSGFSKRLCHPVLATALSAIYLSLVHTFLEDDTPDLAKTMAAIDKRLEIMARLADYRLCKK